jgi:hypothetical protein
MALPIKEALFRYQLDVGTASIGTTPQAAFVRVPKRGRIEKTGVICTSALTGTLAVAVAINGGTAITSAAISQATPASATLFQSLVNSTDAADVNEDDVISFTPSGGTGATTTGYFFALIKE